MNKKDIDIVRRIVTWRRERDFANAKIRVGLFLIRNGGGEKREQLHKLRVVFKQVFGEQKWENYYKVYKFRNGYYDKNQLSQGLVETARSFGVTRSRIEMIDEQIELELTKFINN